MSLVKYFVCICAMTAAVKSQSTLFSNNNIEKEFYVSPIRRIQNNQKIPFARNPIFEAPKSADKNFDKDFDSLLTSVDKDWSQWTEWSFCSRSCEGGVSMRTRRCGIRTMNDVTRECSGSDIQRKLCNTEPCPESSVDFRSVQCSQHDRRPVFSNTQFRWTPYYGTDVQPCQLSCMAVGYNFYRGFGPVQDGTRCSRSRHDVCIDGKCLTVGCNNILGSNLTEDACGVCGGDNSTCYHYTNSYDQLAATAVDFDYNEIAMIPAGATHIRVKDETKNYLALMEADGPYVKYVINGNWVISWPGDFNVAGTVLHYERKDDVETLVAVGPTTKDLHIMMLYLGDSTKVEYEYWIPYSLRPNDLGEFRLSQEVSRARETNEDYYDNLYQDWDVMETTTKRTTTTTTTTPATTTTTTVATTTTTAPPTTVKPSQKPVKVKKSKPAYCTPCKKPQNRKKHYCQSDFVIHARISSKNKVEGKRYRHDISVISVYKSGFKLMKREYLWVYSSCCPKLRPFREYLIMGRKRKVEIGNNGRGIWQSTNGTSVGTGGRKKRYETRLVVDHMDYWHAWKRKYEKGMNKFANRIDCEDVMASGSKTPSSRDPEQKYFPKRRASRRVRH